MRKLFIVGFVSLIIICGCQIKSVNMQSAEIYYSQGDYDKAIEFYTAEVVDNPLNDEAWFELGQCYRLKNNYVKMSEAFDKSLEASDGFYDDIVAEREDLWMKFYNEGVPYFNEQQYEKALLYFENAVIVDSENREGYKERGMCCLQLSNAEADSANKSELLHKAINDFKTFISMDEEGEDLTVRINLGNIYYKNGWDEEAIKIFQEVLKLDPENLSAVSQLATIYRERGDSEKAVEMYNRILNTQAENPDLWFNLGILYFQMENFEEAKKSFDKVLEIYPDDVETLMNLVSSLWKAEMETEAIPYLERVTIIEPDNVAAWQFLFVAYTKVGEIEKANAAFKKYKELGGN